MSNVIKDTLNEGDIVSIPESLTKGEEEEQQESENDVSDLENAKSGLKSKI